MTSEIMYYDVSNHILWRLKSYAMTSQIMGCDISGFGWIASELGKSASSLEPRLGPGVVPGIFPRFHGATNNRFRGTGNRLRVRTIGFGLTILISLFAIKNILSVNTRRKGYLYPCNSGSRQSFHASWRPSRRWTQTLLLGITWEIFLFLPRGILEFWNFGNTQKYYHVVIFILCKLNGSIYIV